MKGKEMAHNLEIVNGQASFATRGEPAWHKLGVVFNKDENITTSKMMELANLNGWNIRLEPVNIPSGYRTITPAFNVVRTSPADGVSEILAVVGDRYQVYQNEDLFQFADNLTDGGAQWETAGSIKQGRQVFGSLAVPREFILDPKGIADKTVTYLLVTTSHDGSASIQAMITPVRVVCQNTLNMALKSNVQSFKVRHTQNTQGRVSEAQRVLGLTMGYMDSFEDIANQLFAKPITDNQFNKLVKDIYPAPDSASKGSMTVYNQKIDLIQGLYKSSTTQDGIRGTAWGALNALTERIDYYRNARGGNSEGIIAAASGFESGVNTEKNRIFTKVLAMAGVK